MEEAYRANPDGFGLLFLYNGCLYNEKGCLSTYEMLERIEKVEMFTDEYIIHFRTASSGLISEENCHPFSVNKNLAFVENGNLFEYSNFYADGFKDSLTDIQRFNNQVLKKLPDDFLYNPDIREALEQYCYECCVKMIFMDSDGDVTIINESAGEWVNGCWYSNSGIKNYVGYGYSGAYCYNIGDRRHKGGLISRQLFSKGYRNKWGKCNKCIGWYPKDELTENKCQACQTHLNLLSYIIDE